MRQVLIDSHVHTILSGHAYSTVIENARYCHDKGMQGFVHADHGPKMPLSMNDWGINIIFSFPEMIEGVRVFKGVEANILDFEGTVDVHEKFGRKLEFVIASMHDVVINPGTVEQNTAAAVFALRKNYIDIIGHPDRLWALMDHETIVKETKNLGKIIEINNHSFRDPEAAKNCEKILKLCRKHDVRISLASDAHIACNVGNFSHIEKMIDELDFPFELIVNRDIDTFEKYLSEREYRK